MINQQNVCLYNWCKINTFSIRFISVFEVAYRIKITSIQSPTLMHSLFFYLWYFTDKSVCCEITHVKVQSQGREDGYKFVGLQRSAEVTLETK